MTQSPKSRPATRTPLWLRLVLLGSLAVNLLVLGAVAGHVLNDKPRDRVPRVDRVEAPMTFALTHKDRRDIGRALREEYRQNRPSRQEIQAEYRGIIAALRADPFDPDVVASGLERQRLATQSRMEIGHDLLLQHLIDMSADDRRAFADRLEEGLKRGPSHDKRPGKGKGPYGKD